MEKNKLKIIKFKYVNCNDSSKFYKDHSLSRYLLNCFKKGFPLNSKLKLHY